MIMSGFETANTNVFLHAYGHDHNFRVVALQATAAFPEQQWTVDALSSGRFLIHTQVEGADRYLTAETRNGRHVFTSPQDPHLIGQIWRGDQGPFNGLVSLGKSGKFLQADDDGFIVCEPDDNGPRGFMVELVTALHFGNGSAWKPFL
jgi:hypothetical protein